MKYGARPLLLLAVLTACGPSTETAAERAAAAARADSSAAGYEVGDGTIPAHTRPGADSVPTTITPIVQPGGTSVSTGGAATPQSPSDSAGGRGSPAGSGTVATAGRGTADRSTGSGPANTNATPSRRDSANPALPPLDPALERNYIAYDTVRKTVTFQLAASDEIREQVSFNGVQRGGRTLTVPLGWRVTIAFANRDPDLPHSATVVDLSGTIPEELPAPVFARAQTIRMAEGLLEGDSDELLFTADRVGRYLIACGVLGHAQRGQWIALDVSTTATTPTYR